MGRKRRSKNLIKTHHWRPPEARDTATAHTTSARRPAVPQSYLGLMSGAPAVCLPSFSAFPHEQLRSFQSKSNCQTSDPRIFLPRVSAGSPLVSPASIYGHFSRVNKSIWHLRLRRGPVGPNLPAETLRAQRHPTAHTAARTRWVVIQLGIKRWERYHRSFGSSGIMRRSWFIRIEL